MSFNILVIPEDATKDHYMLKPIIEKLAAAAGRPRARVVVMTDPAAQGIARVMAVDFLQGVVRRYPMVDLFILCVDRDGLPGRDAAISGKEASMREHLRDGSQSFVASAAHQELEVWCLAGMDDLPRDWQWRQIRDHPNPKETFYLPYAKERGLLDAPGDGREILAREAARRYSAIASKCAEVATLQGRVSDLAR